MSSALVSWEETSQSFNFNVTHLNKNLLLLLWWGWRAWSSRDCQLAPSVRPLSYYRGDKQVSGYVCQRVTVVPSVLILSINKAVTNSL